MPRHNPEELLEFPCAYEFKAFGVADATGRFAADVRSAVSTVVPVSAEAFRVRHSSGGKYLCVTVMAYLQNAGQLKAIYAVLRELDGLKYLL